ncbi:hypothetical protein CFN78_08520 [Amycolatopsis antarctica]|uniref:Uncharacterized protein n=1 Tax=Amycolatopsis antarctica TaxID=1854586 RepID=A0A263D5V1_9PSEU|nr:hypothetical protein [Amycolatopsis antarctica]OZM73569.1 hypothetical protein CFN78_08520 [Amycolatopsis antarctica]
MIEVDWQDRFADALNSIRAALGDLNGPRTTPPGAAENTTAFRNSCVDQARNLLRDAARAVERARDASDYQ